MTRKQMVEWLRGLSLELLPVKAETPNEQGLLDWLQGKSKENLLEAARMLEACRCEDEMSVGERARAVQAAVRGDEEPTDLD